MNTEAFRPLQPDERRLLETLLDHHRFDGRDQLRRQLDSVTARLVMEYKDNYGSIELHVANASPASVRFRVPVEGQYLDDDGMPVWLLLAILVCIAKQERIRLSERVHAGLRRAQGKVLGRPCAAVRPERVLRLREQG